MKGKLIVIDGTDGSGKRTQAEMLADALNASGKKAELLSFPCYESFFGSLVADYLHAKYGDPTTLPPELASMIYALDRFGQRDRIKAWLDDGKIVVLDRYVESNFAYQCAKISDANKKKEMLSWLMELEYVQLGMPRPDMIIFLCVPIDVSGKLIDARPDKKYLSGKKKDGHEASREYMQRVSAEYMELARSLSWAKIECCDEKTGKIKTREEIHKLVMERVEKQVR